MMVTDFSYKREQARASYEMKRSWLKARRIAIRVLVDLEQRVTGFECPAVHAGTVDPSILHTYLPDETTTHLAGLLSSHMGPHVYWSGFGTRWWIGCRDVPPAALRDMRDRVGWVRGLLRPDNIVFRRL
ncbi:hypothetical protein WJX74_009427 [Apatococcus lobatus]|uniref:Uncharacterized protein n=1 Tax=Apatococcus lobatus TaxID=904363 RepID=A0AAW1R0S8_9CHLO